ncbi:hypothetical protein DFH07DRAFT_780299 [Mycena maculata]|uniref:Uncharacterized protein n=1 Tax=Mycena maculata TaxID=230809 RepID=A0AAD7I4T6_9AGAR|nr:hypothetical protein DFH07DRAFT_780299 [Mycena maculata]
MTEKPPLALYSDNANTTLRRPAQTPAPPCPPNALQHVSQSHGAPHFPTPFLMPRINFGNMLETTHAPYPNTMHVARPTIELQPDDLLNRDADTDTGTGPEGRVQCVGLIVNCTGGSAIHFACRRRSSGQKLPPPATGVYTPREPAWAFHDALDQDQSE